MNKLISHRANLNGPNEIKENTLESILYCLEKTNYDVEIDIRYIENTIQIGHDLPSKEILTTFYFLNIFTKYKDRLWIHCKNIEAMIFFSEIKTKFNYFGHSNDEFVITSFGYIFTRPNIINKNAVVVMPEIICDNIIDSHFECIAILTDYPIKYETRYNSIRA
jgi:hypothetical protein